MESNRIMLEMIEVVKDFPGNRAVDKVSFDCRSGEVHCLVGENGAGKSTLMKMLAGVHQPETGQIIIEGEKCSLSTNAESRRKGIGVVYQELSLLPDFSVAENISMGMWPRKNGRIDWKKVNGRAVDVLKNVNLELDPEELVSGLPMAVRQMVEIGKVLSQNPKIIIFDEPTASLSKDEVKILFQIVNKLKKEGKAIIYISHRLEEIFELADRVTIMKDGKKVVTDQISEFDENKLISKMVGRDLKDIFPPKAEKLSENEIFSMSVKFNPEEKPVALNIQEGEVLGIGGLQGQGQIKLLQSMFGLEHVEELRILINGTERIIHNQSDAVKAGMALIPENRGEEGVFLGASVYENISAATLDKRKKMGFIKRNEEQAAVAKMVKELSVKISSEYQNAESLSGGNMQKLVLGKWLVGNPEVIILIEPTKGVDVGTKQQIYRIIREIAGKNTAVLMYTSDMLELIGVSDKVLVMNNCRFTAELTGAEITEENIMKAAVSVLDIDGDEVRA